MLLTCAFVARGKILPDPPAGSDVTVLRVPGIDDSRGITNQSDQRARLRIGVNSLRKSARPILSLNRSSQGMLRVSTTITLLGFMVMLYTKLAAHKREQIRRRAVRPERGSLSLMI